MHYIWIFYIWPNSEYSVDGLYLDILYIDVAMDYFPIRADERMNGMSQPSMIDRISALGPRNYIASLQEADALLKKGVHLIVDLPTFSAHPRP